MKVAPVRHAAALITATLFATVGLAIAKDAVPSVRIAGLAGDRPAAICYTFDDGLRDQPITITWK